MAAALILVIVLQSPILPGGGFTDIPWSAGVLEQQRIIIGHDVWLGTEVRIRRGVTIGTGAVVGQRALVTHDVPPYAIVGGVPARVIRMRFPEQLCEALLASRWWEYAFPQLEGLNFADPWQFVRQLSERRAAGLQRWCPTPLTADEVHVWVAAQAVRSG